MKKLFLSVAVLALSAGSLFSQTIDEIVAKHINAIGGADKLKAVRSLVMESTIKVQGLEMENQTSIIINHAVRNESTIMGNSLVQAFDGAMAWENTPVMMGGSGQPKKMADELAGTVINQADPFALLDYAAKGTTLELLATEEGGYHFKITPKAGSVFEIWIDANTHLVNKQKSFQNGQEVMIAFSNFAETGGIKFATHMDVMAGMISIDTKSVKLNSSLDRSIFKMPALK